MNTSKRSGKRSILALILSLTLGWSSVASANEMGDLPSIDEIPSIDSFCPGAGMNDPVAESEFARFQELTEVARRVYTEIITLYTTRMLQGSRNLHKLKDGRVYPLWQKIEKYKNDESNPQAKRDEALRLYLWIRDIYEDLSAEHDDFQAFLAIVKQSIESSRIASLSLALQRADQLLVAVCSHMTVGEFLTTLRDVLGAIRLNLPRVEELRGRASEYTMNVEALIYSKSEETDMVEASFNNLLSE